MIFCQFNSFPTAIGVATVQGGGEAVLCQDQIFLQAVQSLIREKFLAPVNPRCVMLHCIIMAGEHFMLQTVEAQIDINGYVQLKEPVYISAPHRALVTILERVPLEMPAADNLDFEADMEAFGEDVESLPAYTGTYSRGDIYFDHD